MPKVFISYGRDESYGQNLATEAQQQLQAAGFEVFRDVIGLKPGDRWDTKLEFELESSNLVVLIVSEKVRKSEWVHNEISMAKEIGLPIIPVIAEKVRMPLWLRHIQALDFSEEVDWEHLLSSIRQQTVGDSEVSTQTATDKVEVQYEVVESDDELERYKNFLLAKGGDQENLQLELRQYKDFLDAKAIDSIQTPAWASVAGQDQYGEYADFQFNNVTQRFRLIKPGTFWMGSPSSEAEHYSWETQHEVTLTKPFWLADTTVTQALWLEVLGNNPSHFSTDLNKPVEKVSWNDTQAFIQTLNNQISGLAARLPTEAQWEYACRAGTNTPFSFGSQITPEQVNYDGNYPYANGKEGLYRGTSVPVKSLPENPWGLYEMHGNVWEWCSDSWLEDLGSESVTDPENDKAGALRVVRGGSWYGRGGFVRSASRYHRSPEYRFNYLGLRLSFGHPSASSGGGSR